MPDRAAQDDHAPTRDWVALTLAVGVATALNLITIGVLIAAWYRGQRTGDYALSENATQVLIAAFGGFIGILGGYVGGTAVARARVQADRSQQTAVDSAVATVTAAPAVPLEVELSGPVEFVEADRVPGEPPDAPGSPRAGARGPTAQGQPPPRA